jgi:maleate isomerase
VTTSISALRIGVLTPHRAAGPEIELPLMGSAGLRVVVARVPAPDSAGESVGPPVTASGLRAAATTASLADVGTHFGNTPVDVLAYASTTTGYALGHAPELELVARLEEATGLPVVTSATAAVQALSWSGARRVTVIHPPWFDDEMTDLGRSYFQNSGLGVDVVTAAVQGDPEGLRADQVLAWATFQQKDWQEPLFFAGDGFRVAEVIDALERQTGQLVLTANQVLLWAAMRATRAGGRIDGYGRLFDATTPGLG